MQVQDNFFSVDFAWVLEVKMIGLNSIRKKGVFAEVPSILPPPKQEKSPAASVGECPLGFLPALEFHNFGEKNTSEIPKPYSAHCNLLCHSSL